MKVVLLLTSLLALGCNSERSLRGHVDTTEFRLEDAHIVAVSASDRRWHSPISDQTGDFEIKLPVGDRYSLQFTNRTSSGLYDTFAHLVYEGPNGQLLGSFALTEGDDLELGRVHRLEGSSSRALTAQSHDDETDDDGWVDDDDEGSDSDDGDSDDTDSDSDSSGVEDPGTTVCDMDQGADDAPVVSDNSVASSVDVDEDGDSDESDSDCDADGDSDGDSDDGNVDDSDSDSDGDSDTSGGMCTDMPEPSDDACDDPNSPPSSGTPVISGS